jgi:hypothetical protein
VPATIIPPVVSCRLAMACAPIKRFEILVD